MADELVCGNCNTPVVNIPVDYQASSSNKKIIIIVVIFIICNFLFTRINAIYLEKKYVEPYVQENFNDRDISINYDSSGKCVLSGNCFFDPVAGLDGGSCEEYSFLADCKAYYYKVESSDSEVYVTVYFTDGEYSVVQGKNISGSD